MQYESNGRVKLIDNETIKMYPMAKVSKKQSDFNDEAIKGIHSDNPLSAIFFSQTNMDAVQEAIRYQIYEKSCKKHIIGRQSEVELKVIMRAIYLQDAAHRTHDILAEVKRLNGLVLNYCVPRILQEINMYMTYTADINKLPQPMERGSFETSKGSRVLEQKYF